jgi:translocation and assembly module TamB
MSDLETTPTPPSTTSEQPRPRYLRHLLMTGSALAALVAVIAIAFSLWICSSGCEELVRKRLITTIESSTGGRVNLGSFHWRPFQLEADVNGLVIHGREAAAETPYARIEHLQVKISLLGFWSPRILLRELILDQPQIHLIVYPDGSTNQPQPRKQKKSGKSALDTIFDLKAGHIAIQNGILNYENRAASFDFQDRLAPLNLDAKEVSLLIGYVPATKADPESYHIVTGGRDLKLIRGNSPKTATKAAEQLVQGTVQATLDLTRSAAYLRSLSITSRSRDVKERTLEISGSLQNFSHPRWHAKVTGELNMRLLEPITGYPFAPEGIARIDLSSAGHDGLFRADGSVHAEKASYIGTGVVATGVGLDARIHADAEQLLITSIVARLRQGGQIEGEVLLDHWLPPLSGAATMQQASVSKGKSHEAKQPAVIVAKSPAAADAITLPVDGKVKANFKNVALDTILEMVVEPPFQHLGFDTYIGGPTIATWVGGDVRTLSVIGQLNLTPPGQVTTHTSSPTGKVPASGSVDGTYTQRDGAVDLRLLRLQLPTSQLEARGHLGSYPLASPTAITVDFHSGNLGEFDTVLRDLEFKRNGKSGTAALPVALGGQADFHGTWSGSLVTPHIAGIAKATQLAVEMPQLQDAKQGSKQPVPTTMVRFESVELTGSYSAERIAIEKGQLHRGKSDISLSGTLQASTGSTTSRVAPSFDGNSLLHLRLRAAKIGFDDLQLFTGKKLPVTGVLSSQIEATGPLRALSGSGWVEMNDGSVYGESVNRIRAQGTIANQAIKFSSVSVEADSGKISSTGSYDLQSHRFQVDAKGAGLDLSRSKLLHEKGLTATGKLALSVTGSGTLDDPRLEGHATLTGLTVAGEPLGNLNFTAHTANRTAKYEMTTRLEATQLALQGQTSLDGDHVTQARVDFSKFDIGALLKLAHVQGLNGDSSLAGSMTITGPLNRLEDLHGDARINELAATVSGVHLRSEGGVHATLANARFTLDPLHILGENTDLRAQGSLSLKDKRQLDLAASGTINLNIVKTLNPDLTASGTSTFQIEAHGPLQDPGFRGHVEIQNGSLALENLPNSLSQLQGSLQFNQNRLEIKSLTAVSGGGQLSIGGYLAYQRGLYTDLSITGKGVRIRYPEGISTQADATLKLQGSKNGLLLSGDAQITRFTVSPEFDISALATTTNAVQAVVPPDAPSNHIRIDVHLTSSPQLNFQNAYAKLAGDVDLRIRGTVASPSVLGRVSVTEGSATIAGTRYELQRGNIYFTNPVRIQPSVDLNATARVEDYDITLGIHGTLDKPTVNYRSDPPLAEADVVALLALGRTENQQRIYTQQQQQSGANPTTDALLGGALNATVSSRVQKLFGAGSVKVDPNYLGALGNSTSRIIVEEQVGRNLTLTYATNVNTTSQQLLQAEVAINHHVALLVSRDESGVFSMVLKATRRYR